MAFDSNFKYMISNNLSQYLENGVSITPKRRFISFVFLCKILLHFEYMNLPTICIDPAVLN